MSTLGNSQQARTLWLVRHGYRHDVADPSWLTTAERPFDSPVASQGELQAQEVGRRLQREKIDHIFTSPFLRTVQTASYIAEILDMPIHIENGLSEILLEQWFPTRPDFLALDTIAAQFPRVATAHRSRVEPPYPETRESVVGRMAETVRALMQEYSGNLLLVAHGGSISSLAQALIGPEVEVHTPTCCLVQFTQNGDGWTIECNGRDVSHLSFSEMEVRLN